MMVDLAFGLNYPGNIIKKPSPTEKVKQVNAHGFSAIQRLISVLYKYFKL